MKSALVLLALFVACVAGLAPLHETHDSIPGEYIVVLKRGFPESHLAQHIRDLKADFPFAVVDGENQILNQWTIGKGFMAFHAKLSPDMVARERSRTDVAYVERNGRAHAYDDCRVQPDVIWNLARVNERQIDLVPDTYSYQYTGLGVDVYIIDTGIRVSHQEFAPSRAIWGTNTVNDGNNNDCNGHGTHVAGTVAGALYGIAKNATVIAVKVLGCSGSGAWTGVISGVDWAVKNQQSRNKPSVANMSLGGSYLQSVNDAVDSAVDAGISFAVAAGNSNADACNFSPASSALAISVGATTVGENDEFFEEDQRSSFSNFGACVDVLAPGELIKAAWYTSDTATNTISGTSMASPHVAGVAAVILSQQPTLTPAQVEDTILSQATSNIIDLGCSTNACRQTPNRLLFSKTCAF